MRKSDYYKERAFSKYEIVKNSTRKNKIKIQKIVERKIIKCKKCN